VLDQENKPLRRGRANSREGRKTFDVLRFRRDISRGESSPLYRRGPIIPPRSGRAIASFYARGWGAKQIPLDRGRFLQRLAADLILVRSLIQTASIATVIQRRGPWARL